MCLFALLLHQKDVIVACCIWPCGSVFLFPVIKCSHFLTVASEPGTFLLHLYLLVLFYFIVLFIYLFVCFMSILFDDFVYLFI